MALQSRGARRVPPEVLAASVAVALALMGDAFMYAVLPSHTAAFGVPLAAVGLLLSANRWIRLLTNPVAGLVFDRWGRPLPFAAAVGMATVTTAAYGLGTGVAVLLLARMMWGVCWSFLRLGVYLAALEASADARGRLIGVSWGIVRMGALVGLLIGGYLADRLGHRPAALILAGATTVGIAVAWPAVRRARRQSRPPLGSSRAPQDAGRPGSEPGEARGDSVERFAPWPATTQASPGTHPSTRLPQPGAPARASGRTGPAEAGRFSQAPEPPPNRGRIGLGAVAYGATAKSLVIEGLVGATLGRLLADRFGAGVPVAGTLLGVATVTGALLSLNDGIAFAVGPLAGHQADRLGRRRVLQIAALIAAGSLTALIYSRTLPVIFVSVAGLWASGVGLNIALAAAAGDLAPPGATARVMSTFATWVDIGAASGPLFGYLIAARLGFTVTYLIGAVLLCTIMVAAFWIGRRQGAAA